MFPQGAEQAGDTNFMTAGTQNTPSGLLNYSWLLMGCLRSSMWPLGTGKPQGFDCSGPRDYRSLCWGESYNFYHYLNQETKSNASTVKCNYVGQKYSNYGELFSITKITAIEISLINVCLIRNWSEEVKFPWENQCAERQ